MNGSVSNRRPSVSVIVIFRNAGRFLPEAIDSVLGQTYRDWELLLVDDGSTDESAAIALRTAGEHGDRVRRLEHPGHENRGMSASRNLGARHASGPLLAFLDADDVWFPNALADQVAILDAHRNVAMVYGPIQWWYSWTGRAGDVDRDYVETLGVPADAIVQPPRLVPLFLRDEAAVPSGILVRRDIFERLDGFEDEFRGEYEDQVFLAKVCLAEPVFAAAGCWYRYRQHPDSAVSIGLRTGQTDAARRRFLRWLTSYLRDRRSRALDVWLALVLERWRLERPRSYHLVRHGRRIAARFQHVLARGVAHR